MPVVAALVPARHGSAHLDTLRGAVVNGRALAPYGAGGVATRCAAPSSDLTLVGHVGAVVLTDPRHTQKGQAANFKFKLLDSERLGAARAPGRLGLRVGKA